MTKSKKYFLIGVAVFLLILIFLAIDFNRRTVAPWDKNKTGVNE